MPVVAQQVGERRQALDANWPRPRGRVGQAELPVVVVSPAGDPMLVGQHAGRLGGGFDLHRLRDPGHASHAKPVAGDARLPRLDLQHAQVAIAADHLASLHDRAGLGDADGERHDAGPLEPGRGRRIFVEPNDRRIAAPPAQPGDDGVAGQARSRIDRVDVGSRPQLGRVVAQGAEPGTLGLRPHPRAVVPRVPGQRCMRGDRQRARTLSSLAFDGPCIRPMTRARPREVSLEAISRRPGCPGRARPLRRGRRRSGPGRSRA